MIEVGIRELKTHTSEIVRRIRENGETINITYHGEVVARMVPVTPPSLSPTEVTAILADMDQLAAEIGANWPSDRSAVEAIHDVRREL